MGMTYSIFEDRPAMYLTATKGLQNQLSDEFEEIGLTDVRGMSNYECLEEGGTCESASCTEGIACHLRAGGCYYFDAVRKARAAKLRSSNYAWWFTQAATHQDFPTPDILVCDEAHLIAAEMDGYLSVRLYDREVEWGVGADSRDHSAWRDWAKVSASAVRPSAARNKWEKRKLRDLKDRLTKLTTMGDDWIFERGPRGWSFDPLWPAPYLEKWLWRGAKKVILVSATLRPKTLELLGVKDAHFVEYPSPIPVSHRPVYYIPAARMDYRTEQTDSTSMWRWIAKMDGIIEGRLDRKGIIHAVSYSRAQYIKENSAHGAIMVIHDAQSARETIERFKALPPPAILVSPSVHTGYDFPFDEARYQIIAKVPFQPPSLLLKARTAEDKTYPYYLAITTMVQAAGRVCRGPEDFGETFIVDEMAGWLKSKYGKFAPLWFNKAWLARDTIPSPPPLVSRAR